MKRIISLVLTLTLVASAQAGLFDSKGDTDAEKKANLPKQRDEMLAQLYTAKPAMQDVLKKATGYATFSPNSAIGMGAHAAHVLN